MKILPVNNDGLLHEVERVANIIWTEHYTPIIGEGQVKYMLDKYQSFAAMKQQIAEGYEYYMVVDEDDQIQGYLSVQLREEGDILFLSKIYVLSTSRGKGIGKMLMQHAQLLATQKMAKSIRLTVNKDNSGSIAAYHKMGFVTADAINVDIGQGYFMDDYVMELKIA